MIGLSNEDGDVSKIEQVQQGIIHCTLMVAHDRYEF